MAAAGDRLRTDQTQTAQQLAATDVMRLPRKEMLAAANAPRAAWHHWLPARALIIVPRPR